VFGLSSRLSLGFDYMFQKMLNFLKMSFFFSPNECLKPSEETFVAVGKVLVSDAERLTATQ
jgi:hypothetical protein